MVEGYTRQLYTPDCNMDIQANFIDQMVREIYQFTLYNRWYEGYTSQLYTPDDKRGYTSSFYTPDGNTDIRANFMHQMM